MDPDASADVILHFHAVAVQAYCSKCMEIPNDGHDLPDDSDYSFENVHIAENARRGEYCVSKKFTL